MFKYFVYTSFTLPMNFRSDKTLQDIVYKLVPGLFKSKCLMAHGFKVSMCFVWSVYCYMH